MLQSISAVRRTRPHLVTYSIIRIFIVRRFVQARNKNLCSYLAKRALDALFDVTEMVNIIIDYILIIMEMKCVCVFFIRSFVDTLNLAQIYKDLRHQATPLN